MINSGQNLSGVPGLVSLLVFGLVFSFDREDALAQDTEVPEVEESFFNGSDLAGWKGNDGFWTVEDGAIVGHSDVEVPKNEFIWSDVEVRDFYLTVDVKLSPDNRNAGIQFRSKPVDERGQAFGYQADIGLGVWGKLYHEHGRGKLDWNDRAKQIIKRDDWNRYEILVVDNRIWTAINGSVCVAYEDSKGESSGKIAFQIHSGPPQTVRYRNPRLVHNPRVRLAGLNQEQLFALIDQFKEGGEDKNKDSPDHKLRSLCQRRDDRLISLGW